MTRKIEGSMRVLRALKYYAVILSAVALGLSCGTSVEGIAVVVNVKSVPDGAKSIYATFLQDGQPAKNGMPFIVQQDLTRFAVALTDARANKLQIDLQVRGEDGCIIGSGTTMVELTAGVTKFEVSVDLMADSGCPVDLFIDGPGSVALPSGSCSTSCVPGELCSAYCSAKVARGQTALLTSMVSFNAISASWSQACTGSVATACSVTVNGPISVGASFVPRNCSVDGVCAYPMPAGKQVRAVYAKPSVMGSGSKLAAGTEIFSNTQYPNWAAATSNLGTGGISQQPVTRLVGFGSNNGYAALFSDGTLAVANMSSLTSFTALATPGLTGTIQNISRTNSVVVTDAGKIGRISSTTTPTFSLDSMNANTIPLYGVDASANPFFAVGRGVILRAVGPNWTPDSCPTTKTLRAVHVNSDTSTVFGFAVGEGGIILQYSNSTWTVVVPGDGRNLNDVFTRSGNNYAWAVGDGGLIKYYERGVWRDLALPPGVGTPNLTNVSGSIFDNQVVVTGPGDTVFGLIR